MYRCGGHGAIEGSLFHGHDGPWWLRARLLCLQAVLGCGSGIYIIGKTGLRHLQHNFYNFPPFVRTQDPRLPVLVVGGQLIAAHRSAGGTRHNIVGAGVGPSGSGCVAGGV